ncbi:MAG: recombinase family protein [Chloroflexi bacterium]|nr:recombinase family protein [Chloroflexota bacterium]
MPERCEWVRKWVQWLLVEKIPALQVCKRMDESGTPTPMLQAAIDRLMQNDPTLSPESALEAATKGKRIPRWSLSTIKRNLTSKAMLGQFWVTWKDDDGGSESVLVYEDPDLAVMTEAEIAAIEAILLENRALSVRNTKRDYTPLKGFVYCHCGRKAQGSYAHDRPYFRCEGCYLRDDCKIHQTSAHALWQEAREILVPIVKDPKTWIPVLFEQMQSAENKQALGKQRSDIQEELRVLDDGLTRVIRMFEILPNYGEEKLLDEVAKNESRTNLLKAELEQVEQVLRTSAEATIQAEKWEEICRRYSDSVDNADADQWVDLLRDFEVRVVLGKDGDNRIRVAEPAELSASTLMRRT